MVQIISSGGIIVNQDGKIALVQNRRGLWGFPKGHVEEGENELEAAKREIQEEAGIIDLTLIKELGLIKHMKPNPKSLDQPDIIKYILMFLFSSNQVEIEPYDAEIKQAKWISLEKVPKMLKFEVDREFFISKLDIIKETIRTNSNEIKN